MQNATQWAVDEINGGGPLDDIPRPVPPVRLGTGCPDHSQRRPPTSHPCLTVIGEPNSPHQQVLQYQATCSVSNSLAGLGSALVA
jgi:hypothetical protein